MKGDKNMLEIGLSNSTDVVMTLCHLQVLQPCLESPAPLPVSIHE